MNDICPLCLDEFDDEINTITLSCHHRYCYLCLKLNINNLNKCCLCKCDINKKIIDDKNLTIDEILKNENYRWLYSSHKNDGWWLYDLKTNKEIEKHYQLKKDECFIELGFKKFKIDFKNMKQNNTRDIKRLVSMDEIKGIAGIKIKK